MGNTTGRPVEDFSGGTECGYQGAGGEWFTFTASSTGMMQLDGLFDDVALSTCNPGTNFDTRISVFRGTCETLQCVGYNDDACDDCPTDGFHSIAEFMVDTGETYYILVHGYQMNEGSYTLTIDGVGPSGVCEGYV